MASVVESKLFVLFLFFRFVFHFALIIFFTGSYPKPRFLDETNTLPPICLSGNFFIPILRLRRSIYYETNWYHIKRKIVADSYNGRLMKSYSNYLHIHTTDYVPDTIRPYAYGALVFCSSFQNIT